MDACEWWSGIKVLVIFHPEESGLNPGPRQADKTARPPRDCLVSTNFARDCLVTKNVTPLLRKPDSPKHPIATNQ